MEMAECARPHLGEDDAPRPCYNAGRRVAAIAMSDQTKIRGSGSLSQLGGLVRSAGLRLKGAKDAVPAETRSEAPAAPQAPAPAAATDEELFAQAMDGVRRSTWRHAPARKPPSPPPPGADPEAEDRRLLEAALSEETPLPIPEHPEYIEGWVGAAGKKLLPNLRNGLYSIQGQLDLHGFNRVEAEIAVEDYVERMARYGSCCIKIIHGRGINSPANRATLKDALQRLLATRRMARTVVAYASAQSRDGGVGAVYVLLRKQ